MAQFAPMMNTMYVTIGTKAYRPMADKMAERFCAVNNISMTVIGDEEVKNLPPLPNDCWIKGYLWDLVPPSIQRLVYADADFDPRLPLGLLPEVPFSAVRDPGKTYEQLMGNEAVVKDIINYFNSGLFVCTRESIPVFECLKMHRFLTLTESSLQEQTWFNHFVQRILGGWSELPLTWNWLVHRNSKEPPVNVKMVHYINKEIHGEVTLKQLLPKKISQETPMDKKLKISIYTICKNEEKFVDRFMDCTKGADSVVVLDTGSTDNTVEKLRARGAKVEQKKYVRWSTLEEYDAIVARGEDPWRFDKPRNISIDMIPDDTDICISIDLDEVLEPGWRDIVESMWRNGVTRSNYMYAWSPEKIFRYNKIHARHGYEWRQPIHETLYPKDESREIAAFTDKLLVRHFPDGEKSRGQYLPLLELAVRENPKCERSSYYLGREYTFYSKLKEAIAELKRYLSFNGGFKFERSHACLLIASAYGRMNQKDEQRTWILHACAEEPNQREAWVELADFYRLQGHPELAFGAAKHALKINHVPSSHLNDPAAWGVKPYDIAGVAAYYIGLKKESFDLCFKSLEMKPDEQRFIDNCNLIQDLSALPVNNDILPTADVIILSYAKTQKEYEMTKRTIKSLKQSTPSVKLNVIVVETNSDLKKCEFYKENDFQAGLYGNHTLLMSEPFNYNKFLQAGFMRESSHSKYLMIINNDIPVFSPDFVKTLIGEIKGDRRSVSGCGLREMTHSKFDMNVPVIEGYDVNRELVGWCILFDKDILKKIAFSDLFPADFKFYYQDVYYGHMLKKHGIKHGLVTAAKALHLQQQSHSLMTPEQKKQFIDDMTKVFYEKTK